MPNILLQHADILTLDTEGCVLRDAAGDGAVAAAERLGVRRVATFDRRPLAVLAPRGPRGERLLDFEP